MSSAPEAPTPTMILLDQPYLSDFLRDTITRLRVPVVATPAAREFGLESFPVVLSEEQAIAHAGQTPHPLIQTISESSLAWIAEHLGHTALPAEIERFKNKAAFREATRALYPELYFEEIAFEDLGGLDVERLPAPFILKPTVGFFSLGVVQVDSPAAWPAARAELEAQLASAAGLFPKQVLDTTSFLIEQRLDGPEFAIDAYFDERGEPVVLSILEHRFASDSDMTDRLYSTSRELIERHLERFTEFLADLGRIFEVRRFPVHVEVRLDAQGRPIPIEVNPLRFGGWCTTADLTHHAFGLNPYQCYFSQERPDWEQLLHGKQDQVFSIVALGNSTGIAGAQIAEFDYERLLARFERPLELRKTDFRSYPIFGFVFAATRGPGTAELDWVLESDLREFVR